MNITQELYYIALAIVQAGAFIFSHRCSLARYIELYNEHHGRLLEKYKLQIRVDDYKLTIYATWEISFRQLSKQAASFLMHCAFLHYDGITEAIFQNAAI